MLVAAAWPLAAQAGPRPGASSRGGAPPGRFRFAGHPTVRIRLLVRPKQAEVYLDGYYAGLVDDFDGLFQGLPMRPGPHTIVLYLPGYRTVRERLSVTAGAAYKARYAMARLAAGEVSEPPPAAPAPEPRPAETASPPEPIAPPGPPPPVSRAPAEPSAFGRLSIHAQPADVQVWIDGERWRSPAGADGLIVRVAEGAHTVEIRKAGYRPFSITLDVRAGATTPLNVSLPPVKR